MATIEDVANLAGLSRATVSRVINHHPYVTEEKKKLVQEAMEKLGYVPNSIARQLRKQMIETVAVLIPRISNPFFSKMVEKMESVAAEKGFQLIVCQTQTDKQRELVYLDWLKTKQIGGVIMASSENSWETIRDYTKFGPIVFCNEYPPNTRAPIVCLDQFKGGYIGTRHLIEKGHRFIAYCNGSNHTTNIQDRKRGFDQALKEAGLSFDERMWFAGVFDIRDGRHVFREMLKLHPRPTAIFTGSDEVAAGIISEAGKYGFRVPDDLAVVGFDDQPLASIMTPGITTLHQPAEEIGKEAMAIIIEIMENREKIGNRVIELPLHLVERSST
ncbi:MAG TPA: LacI family DNA-binding transcriptional regulator [Bacillales bacterium]|nr:LacI family DNA-binding transcriptional regulator [Bacillales bacterium]